MVRHKLCIQISLAAFTACILSLRVAHCDDATLRTTPKFVEQFSAIQKETNDKLRPLYEKAQREIEAAGTETEREQLIENVRAESEKIVSVASQQVLNLVKPYAGDSATVEPLIWIVKHDRHTDNGRAAAALLMKHHLVRPETIELSRIMKHSGRPWVEAMLRAQLAAPKLPKEQKWKVMLSLAMCLQGQAEVATRMENAADDELQLYERVNGKDRVAELRLVDSARMEAEAVRLFTDVATMYPEQEIARGLRVADIARSSIFEIMHLGVGKMAPEIEAEDLDGEKFKLSDYRGQVIMLSFWGSWCGPCMGLVPHHRELVERYKGKPFVLVGVNSDQDRANLKPVLDENKITWQSFWCGSEGPQGAIARAWNVNVWPTTYLIDHTGVIRAKQLMGSLLDAKLSQLVAEAERLGENH